MNNKLFSIIEKEKFLVWLPEKTASTHAFEVLKNYDICRFQFTNNQLIRIDGSNSYDHTCDLFDGHENYSIISTARNPYSKFVSFYKFMGADNRDIEFYDYVHELIINKPSKLTIYNKRVPDYFIRQEHVFEDYLKIPFIKNSDFYKSGQLKDLCDKKINHNKNSYDYREYYNQDIADLVYYNFSKYFDLLGYDKNSWKK
jgi:hypothetical protein